LATSIPPVHAWATIFTYSLEKARTGQGDFAWRQRSFQKLLLNFTWWLNRKDRSDKNAFEGGFLGLDNIGVFDRSSPLPTGGYLEPADGTAWMALFSLNMLEIALELVTHDPTYGDTVFKCVHLFVSIASATVHAGGNTGMFGGNSNGRGPGRQSSDRLDQRDRPRDAPVRHHDTRSTARTRQTRGGDRDRQANRKSLARGGGSEPQARRVNPGFRARRRTTPLHDRHPRDDSPRARPDQKQGEPETHS
jgi:hypothetical protein